MLTHPPDPERAMSAEPGVVTDLTADRSTAILLAEDDPVTRMLMTRFLKKAGYEVDAVARRDRGARAA